MLFAGQARGAHIDNGESAYYPRVDIHRPHGLNTELPRNLDVHQIAEDVVARIHADPDFAAEVARQLRATPTSSRRLTRSGEQAAL